MNHSKAESFVSVLLATSRSIHRAILAVAVTAGAVSAQSFPTRPPGPLPVTPAQFPPFQQATLANGLKLLVVSNSRLPVLSMSLAFPAGGQYDPDGKTGTADMVAALLTKGAGQRDADAVSTADRKSVV